MPIQQSPMGDIVNPGQLFLNNMYGMQEEDQRAAQRDTEQRLRELQLQQQQKDVPLQDANRANALSGAGILSDQYNRGDQKKLADAKVQQDIMTAKTGAMGDAAKQQAIEAEFYLRASKVMEPYSQNQESGHLAAISGGDSSVWSSIVKKGAQLGIQVPPAPTAAVVEQMKAQGEAAAFQMKQENALALAQTKATAAENVARTGYQGRVDAATINNTGATERNDTTVKGRLLGIKLSTQALRDEVGRYIDDVSTGGVISDAKEESLATRQMAIEVQSNPLLKVNETALAAKKAAVKAQIHADALAAKADAPAEKAVENPSKAAGGVPVDGAWMTKAKELNPKMSDEDLIKEWQKKHPGK
jgi:hypothetical protein